MLTQSFVNISKAEIDYAKASGVKLGGMIDINPDGTRGIEQSPLDRQQISPTVTRYALRDK